MNLKLKMTVSLSDVANLLCSALEGGSNYWYAIEKKVSPRKVLFHEPVGENGPAIWTHEYPLNPGGQLVFSILDPENEQEKAGRWTLGLQEVKKGLSIMAENYPAQFSDVLRDSADAETGDVFLQCCLFGKVIYG